MSQVVASETTIQPQLAYPSVFIRILAQATTALHFLQSLAAMVLFWLWPSLTPEPRLHRYISSTPQVHHHQHRHSSSHHHQHAPRRRNSRKLSTSLVDEIDTLTEALIHVDKALEGCERPVSPVERWEDGRRTVAA